MIVFSLDTTSGWCSISISEDYEVLREIRFRSRGDLSARLIPAIDQLYRKGGVTLDDTDLFAVVNGPGLFTGIRIGMATVKGLCFQTGRPVVTVNSLRALAEESRCGDQRVYSLWDARRREVYFAGYEFRGEEDTEVAAPRLAAPGRIPKLLAGAPAARLGGIGIEHHLSRFQESLPGMEICRPSPYLSTSAARLALRDYRRGVFITRTEEMIPLYIRPSDARRPLSSSQDQVQTEKNQD